MADINIRFDQGSNSTGGANGSNDYLIGILQKLNSTLDKLANAASKSSNAPSNIKSPYEMVQKPFEQISKDFEKAVNDYNNSVSKKLELIGNRMGSSLMTGALAGATVLATRYAGAETTAIIARATSRGSFAAAGIQGGANQEFGNYVGSYFDIEKNRRQNEHSANYEAAGAAVAAGIATFITKSPAAGAAAASITGRLIAKGAATLGGYEAGKYFAAGGNALTEEQMLQQRALATSQANASVSQWRTGFSRFGLKMSQQEIASSQITGGAAISVPLAQEFENRYRGSQNYNAILNGIVPNLNTNPLDRGKTGDLNNVAQNFLKAGFAVGEFGKLTLQSAQYTAISGKNIEQFSEEIKQARKRFGEGFDSGTLQNTLNLMAIGYDKNQAANLAYQSQFNPGIAGNVGRYANQGYSDFYRNQALSGMLGLNVNETLRTGSFVGSKASREKYTKEIQDYFQHGKLGAQLGLALATGTFTPASLQSTLQGKAAVNTLGGKAGLDSSLSPGQEAAQGVIGAITDGLKNVQNMSVTAQIVNIAGQGLQSVFPGQLGANLNTLARNIVSHPPSAQGSKVSPAAKP
jgi:hypothetical protein